MIMSFEGYQEALESQSKKENELNDMKVQFNTMQSMLEKLIAGLSNVTPNSRPVLELLLNNRYIIQANRKPVGLHGQKLGET